MRRRVGAAHGHRAHLTKEGARGVVVRASECNGAIGVTEVPMEGRLGVDDDGEGFPARRPRPVRGHGPATSAARPSMVRMFRRAPGRHLTAASLASRRRWDGIGTVEGIGRSHRRCRWEGRPTDRRARAPAVEELAPTGRGRNSGEVASHDQSAVPTGARGVRRRSRSGMAQDRGASQLAQRSAGAMDSPSRSPTRNGARAGGGWTPRTRARGRHRARGVPSKCVGVDRGRQEEIPAPDPGACRAVSPGDGR